MRDYAFLVFIMWIKVLVSLTQDFQPSVSCNMELSTWLDAWKECIRRDGHIFPFESGLGDKLHIKSEIDVWTADYLIISKTDYYSHDSSTAKYCGFNYLNSTFYENNETFYGDCNTNRNYFCINKTGNLVVYNNSREKIDCGYKIPFADLYRMRYAITPGFYWHTRILYGTAGIARRIGNYINTQGILCGAYKSSIGMYYANCTEKRFSLCSSNGNGPINNFCYDRHTATVTENTTIATEPTAMSTTSRRVTIADASHTSTKHPMKEQTSTKNKTKAMNVQTQEEEQSSDIGIKVGVPLGIILPLTCGVLIIIYIYRKSIKCWQSSNSKHENGRMNQFHIQETSPVHCQLNIYSESIQETQTSSEPHTRENNLTDISAQYAVVKKPKKGDTKSRKDASSNKSYQNATNDEYDVAGRFQNCSSNQSDNLYNHFESVGEYNSASLFKKEGEFNNLYNTAGGSSLVESDYDSTTQVNNTALPDDVYNHVSQDDKNYDSTSNTRNK